MHREGPVNPEVGIDTLIQRAEGEVIQAYTRKVLAGTSEMDDPNETALVVVDAIVSTARTQIRAINDAVAGATAQVSEVLEPFTGTWEATQMKGRVMEQADVTRQRMEQEVRTTISKLLTDEGVSEGMATALVKELFVQEAKLLRFPKKS